MNFIASCLELWNRFLDWVEDVLRPTAMGSEPRSPRWGAVRAKYIKEHPECSACGDKDELEIHHVKPYHEDRSLELEPDNLITLCRDCHFYFGHLKSWRSWNVTVREDAVSFRKRVEERP